MHETIVLMAAGLGVRLGDKTKESPKTLLKVNGQEMASYILKGLGHFPHYPLVVITGFFTEKLTKFFKDKNPKIECLYNPNYKDGNLKTLLCAEERMNNGFVVFNSDHVYSLDVLKKIFRPRTHITAFCDFDRSLFADDMKVVHVDKTIAKLFSKTIDQDKGGYVGVTQVPPNKIEIYKKVAHDCLKKHGSKINVEQVLNELVALGEPVDICDVSGSYWFEVDNDEDLKKAEDQIEKLSV